MSGEIPSSGFKEKLTFGSVLLIVGAVLSIAGSFMSWANLGVFSVSGSSGDGKFTAIAGAVSLIIVLFVYSAKKRNTAITTIGFLVGLFTIFVTSYDGTNVSNSGSAIISAGVGTGIYVVFLGGVLSVLGSISLIANLSKDTFYKLGEISKKNKVILVLMILLAIGIAFGGYFSASGKTQGMSSDNPTGGESTTSVSEQASTNTTQTGTISNDSEITAVAQAAAGVLHDGEYHDWIALYQTFNAESQHNISEADYVKKESNDAGNLNISGFNIDNVSFIDSFTDPNTKTTYRHVAVVSYSVTAAIGQGQPETDHETMHLVNESGQWKSFFHS
ncbi:MAG: hypothetical protein M0Z32_04905 [Actinomycetota bacterium]|nr:tripartite tricarboxylate transporter TctB family protein [Actinomycetota bacterium]MCL6094165.1 tripartite tricarboxylate transporter TctB family protein [Actinomycetota bacterium]MDA8167078.1 hypothetical protein [Actinomycetota bacterium]